MFVVTNRQLHPEGQGFDIFGSRPSDRGPNELRLVRVERAGKDWLVEPIPDELDDAHLDEIGIERKHDAQGKPIAVYASRYVAYHTLRVANPRRFKISGQKGKNVVLFVHGYNNTVRDVVERAARFQDYYKVEVLVFTWPANGGGIHGVTDYLDDKRDARASIGALDRTLDKMYELLNEFNEANILKIKRTAVERYGADAEQRDQYIANMTRRECPFTVNLVLHSMGNYLFKQLLKSGVYRGRRLLFDNVVMVAADANNLDHALWVDQIRCRRRVFITVNENDRALAASRMKSGEEQLARLGHYTRNLDSREAVYVDFTHAAHVGNSHAYFEGKPVEKNPRVRMFFQRAFNGECAEEDLKHDAPTGTYRVR